MSLPDQEVLDGIKDLISEVTTFKEDDENFDICLRYCLSHVVHHTYPFVSKSTVKNLINSYVSRFYGHGYFRVSQELNNQIKSFLSNEKLFEKNPQYDIQWCLLSLVSSLSSNLTSVKELPELLPIEDEETESEDFDWKEYLKSDLPEQTSLLCSDEDLSEEEEDDDDDEEEDEEVDDDDISKEKEGIDENSETKSVEKSCQNKKNLEIIYHNKSVFDPENSSQIRQQRIEEFLKKRRSRWDLENDFKLRGNISQKFDVLINEAGIVRKSQLVSEFEMMENILFQFQTGERIFLRKGLVNPALTSLTEDTLSNYLESLELYFKIVRSFREFDTEITETRYSGKCVDKKWVPIKGSQSLSALSSTVSDKKSIPNVLYMYNAALRKALEPFQNELTEIVENLGNYTLIQMEQKLQSHYCDLTTLYSVHTVATKNWKKECNWMSSIRILSVLYSAIMDATSARLSFLYLNFFLQCFHVYLDLIDSWISFHDLIDPNDEFIVTKSIGQSKSENKCSEYEIRPYKSEIENLGVKNVVILDLISEKMIEVGQSLEVLRRLNRYAKQEGETSKETLYNLLVESINEKVRRLGTVNVIQETQKPEKPKSIFTMKNIGLCLERDCGGGDSIDIGSFPVEVLEEDEKKIIEKLQPIEAIQMPDARDEYCSKFIFSMVRNPFFKLAFENIGMKQVEKQLEEARHRLNQNSGSEALMVIKNPEEGKSGIYPLHKIITEAFHKILENRISGACSLVKDIVLIECNLPRHLSLLRSILLFNDSYLIQPFVLAVFTQPVIWGSSYSLSLHLKECVRSFYKDYANGLSVILTKKEPKCENVLQVIDSITVYYEVKWPLTLIITPEAMRKYNEIFRLALKLKWAHWALCSLHLQDKDKVEMAPNPTLHRLQLLRFWLLSTLGRINNYFLTQMTPPDLELGSCNDLKEIIYAHSEFLDRIHHNCLLGEKSPEGRKLITETFTNLCMSVLVEDADVDDAQLSAIETKFGNCHLLVSHLLSSLEK